MMMIDNQNRWQKDDKDIQPKKVIRSRLVATSQCFFYKNKVYKNIEPDILDKIKNIFVAEN